LGTWRFSRAEKETAQGDFQSAIGGATSDVVATAARWPDDELEIGGPILVRRANGAGRPLDAATGACAFHCSAGGYCGVGRAYERGGTDCSRCAAA